MCWRRISTTWKHVLFEFKPLLEYMICISSHVFLPFIFSSPEENSPLGDGGSAGSVSGGAGCGCGLCHPHQKCTYGWLLLRHRCEWQSAVSKCIHPDDETLMYPGYFVVMSRWSCCISSWALELFWVLLASTWWKTASPWWVRSCGAHVAVIKHLKSHYYSGLSFCEPWHRQI